MKNYKNSRVLRFLSLVLTVLFITSLMAGCSNSVSTTQKDPFKIGILIPYSGTLAHGGMNLYQGVEMYLDEIGWKAAGRDIKLIKEDDESSGQVGLQKTRKLIESDRIDVLTGVMSSTVAYAIRDYVVSSKIPFIIGNAGASDLTRENGSKNIFRVSFANGQMEYPMGTYAAKTLKYKKVVVMASDYAAGHEKAQGFIDGFKAAGGEIVQELYPKLGATDFAPYLTQVKQADAVWVYFVGNDSISFAKQYSEYGLRNKIPLLCAGEFVDESVLPEHGDLALGLLSTHHYSSVLNIPENKKFSDAYTAKYKEEANMGAVQGYLAAKTIIEALKVTDGNNKDTEKFLDAIAKVKFDSPHGPFRFDPVTRNVVFNVYVRKVEKVNGRLVNSIIDNIPDVADYWKPQK